MNTISSVYYGWAWLIVCGGGSYYFAKRAINADRAERASLEQQRRATQQRQIEQQYRQASSSSPSQEAAGPEPSPGAGHSRGVAASKYEASEPYISVKGDRFSRLGKEERDKKS